MTPDEYEAARDALGWTHAKLAETIGVSIRTPYRYQGGEGAYRSRARLPWRARNAL
jgi:hypothetical protein